ncbi:uncharacterized protein LOC122733919 [Dromiciops gliroides]|uniref:uncharacterized protein LOC122733919 n=1 Tax=Dromiciops gliroides TaxID=33562 RepID=UPI001CC617A1|nr:uncharacterized protein LOC122733919 [Dromiciops gliroides]
MEPLDGCPDVQAEHAPNGYAGLLLSQASAEIEVAGAMELGDLELSAAVDGRSKEETSWLKKKAKVNKIWNFVSRKKGPLGQGKRPQSMIVLGGPMKTSENKPKITFMDRMKSIKRLRSSSGLGKGASQRSFKAQSIHDCPSDQEDGLWQRDLNRVKRLPDNQKPFRHSYAGHTEGLEACFEDVELSAPVPEMEVSDGRGLRDVDVQMNEDQEETCPRESEDIKNEDLNVASHSLRAARDCRKRCQTLPQDIRRRRTSDVWSYLKGISLASKENSKATESDLEGNFQDLESATTGNSTLYLDLESGHEESPSQVRKGSSTSKATHFGGVFKFFTNMAEAARKWRGSSRPPFQEEPKPSSQGHQLQPQEVPEDDGVPSSFLMRLSLQSPDSGIWDHSTLQTPMCRDNGEQGLDPDSLHVACSLGPNSETQGLSQAAHSQVDTSNFSPSTLQGDDQISPDSSAQIDTHELSEAQPSSQDLCEKPETMGGFLEEKETLEESSEPNEAIRSEQAMGELACEKGHIHVKEEEEEEDGLSQTEEQDSFELLDESGSSKYGPKCRPFQMSLCTIASLTEINNRKPSCHPPHPSPSPPPFKALDRCHSLPLSQSIPMGLDQVGWRRRLLLNPAGTVLNSKTLEVQRERRRKRQHWKPLKPGAEQVLVNKLLGDMFTAVS